MMFTHQITEKGFESLDFTKPQTVEIEIRGDGKVVWINIDGLCRLRVCRIENLTLTDERKKVT